MFAAPSKKSTPLSFPRWCFVLSIVIAHWPLSYRYHNLSFPSLSHFVVSIRNHFGSKKFWRVPHCGKKPVFSFGIDEYERREIPFGGTLCQQEKNYLWDEYRVMCSVRFRKSWNRRMMTMWGRSGNFDLVARMVLDMAAEKQRIDVCKCMGFQSANKSKNQNNQNK